MSLNRWISPRNFQTFNKHRRIANLGVLDQTTVTEFNTKERRVTPHLLRHSTRTKTYQPHGSALNILSLTSSRSSCHVFEETKHLVGHIPEGKEYQCPSRILERFSDLAILDRAVPAQPLYDLPVHHSIILPIADPNPQINEVAEPPNTSSQNESGKFAKEIMRIRHKKMKKHKRIKLRKRMYFVWKKMRLARQSKKDTIYRKELEAIKLTGDNFDPKEFVGEQLRKAKRGGYYINIFESKA